MPDSIPDTKRCIVSGGASGIGRCLTRRLLERGHRVFLFDIDKEELKYTTEVHLKQYRSQLSSAVCDLRSIDDVRSTVAKAATILGNRIDILVNMGGISTPQWKDGLSMDDQDTYAQFEAFVATNLTGPFAVSQACIPYMKVTSEGKLNVAQMQHLPRKGAGPCIIHVGSFRAHQSDANQEGYASSKAGLLGLMHSMAITCEQWGIRVNLVAPGRIKVAHESRAGDEGGVDWAGQLEEKDVSEHPVNRAGTPEDVVDAIEYLIDAGFITG